MSGGRAVGEVLQALRSLLAAQVATPIGDLTGRSPSAVCVPLLEHEGALETWIIRRPSSMRDHSGELGFPGGKPEAADHDLAATAVRETVEELGVRAESIRILGALSPIPVATSRFSLHPFVGELSPGSAPRPNREVADIVRAPLGGFFDGTYPVMEVDSGAYRSPMFQLPIGRLYGASAIALAELLVLFGRAAGIALPAPEVTTDVPWIK